MRMKMQMKIVKLEGGWMELSESDAEGVRKGVREEKMGMECRE